MKQRKRIAAFCFGGSDGIFHPAAECIGGGTPTVAGGLCEHHPEHTTDCGYTEGTEGTPVTMNTMRTAIPLWPSVSTSIPRTATRQKVCRTTQMPSRMRKSKSRLRVPTSAAKKAAVSQRRWTAITNTTASAATPRKCRELPAPSL